MDDLIGIARFGSHIEGDLARSALEAAGIESYLRDDEAGGLYPSLAFSGGVVLCVNETDADTAREILSQTAAAQSEPPAE